MSEKPTRSSERAAILLLPKERRPWAEHGEEAARFLPPRRVVGPDWLPEEDAAFVLAEIWDGFVRKLIQGHYQALLHLRERLEEHLDQAERVRRAWAGRVQTHRRVWEEVRRREREQGGQGLVREAVGLEDEGTSVWELRGNVAALTLEEPDTDAETEALFEEGGEAPRPSSPEGILAYTVPADRTWGDALAELERDAEHLLARLEVAANEVRVMAFRLDVLAEALRHHDAFGLTLFWEERPEGAEVDLTGWEAIGRLTFKPYYPWIAAKFEEVRPGVSSDEKANRLVQQAFEDTFSDALLGRYGTYKEPSESTIRRARGVLE